MKKSIVLSALVLTAVAVAHAQTVDTTDPNLRVTPEGVMEATADVRNSGIIDPAPSGDASNGVGVKSIGCCGADTNSYGTTNSSANNQPITTTGIGTVRTATTKTTN